MSHYMIHGKLLGRVSMNARDGRRIRRVGDYDSSNSSLPPIGGSRTCLHTTPRHSAQDLVSRKHEWQVDL